MSILRQDIVREVELHAWAVENKDSLRAEGDHWNKQIRIDKYEPASFTHNLYFSGGRPLTFPVVSPSKKEDVRQTKNVLATTYGSMANFDSDQLDL